VEKIGRAAHCSVRAGGIQRFNSGPERHAVREMCGWNWWRG
jgi:hypothetical protein